MLKVLCFESLQSSIFKLRLSDSVNSVILNVLVLLLYAWGHVFPSVVSYFPLKLSTFFFYVYGNSLESPDNYEKDEKLVEDVKISPLPQKREYISRIWITLLS